MTPVYMRQTAKRVMVSERCSEVSALLRRDVSGGTYKSIMIRLRLCLSHRLMPPKAHLTLNGRNIPFVNHVKYLAVTFDKRITWRLHKKLLKPRLSEYVLQSTPYSKVSVLSANIKPTLHKVLIRSVMSYACHA
jgi:hypothetical protein